MFNNRNRNMRFSFIMVIALTISIIFVVNFTNKLRVESKELFEDKIISEIVRSNEGVSVYLDSKMQVLQGIAEGIAEDIKNDETIDEYSNIFNVLKGQIGFEYVGYVDVNGMLILDGNDKIDIRHKSYYISSHLDMNSSIGYDLLEKVCDENRIIYIVPIVGKDGVKMGSILAISNPEELQDSFNSKFNKEIGFSYIINKNGMMVYNPNSSTNEVSFINFYQYLIYDEVSLENYVDEIIESINNNPQNVIKVDNDLGKGYIGHSEVYKNSDWQIIAYVISDGDADYIKNKELIASIITLIVIGFIVVVYILLSEINKQKEINSIYSIDDLTGISNWNKFKSDAKKLIAKDVQKEYIIAIADIQNFRYINYFYGISQGDDLLRKVGKVLKLNFYGDETCARISGDKFIVLAKNTDNFYEKIKGILLTVLNDYENNTHRITFQYNFGFYIIDKKYEDIDDAFEKVNIAWNYCKKEGIVVDYKYYNDELLDYLMKEEILEKSMREALLNDEFIVYLQPKINILEKKVCGVEALIRWISPSMGFMPPDEFIPIFERNGFIIDLDFFVLDEMLKFIHNRATEGKSLFTVSVNQSRETLRSKDYISKLSILLKKYNIPPELLEIEITESIFVMNYNELKNIISEIRSLGVKISMDDFGSGYSSLNLLKEMNIDIIKLDRGFLDEVITSEKSKIIIKSIINMAKELNLEVVCEGVETKEHSEFLSYIGCSIAQGYYYGRPITVEEFILNNEQ